MKLRLTAGFSSLERVELGTLEYADGKYVWTANEEEKDEKYRYFVEDFQKFSGLQSKGVQESEKLFSFFSSRISANRKSVYFMEMLQRLGMEEYEEWEYICKSGLKTAIDSYELVMETEDV